MIYWPGGSRILAQRSGQTAALPLEFQFWAYFCEASLIRNLSRADLIETNVRWAHPTGVKVCDMIAEGNSPGGTVKRDQMPIGTHIPFPINKRRRGSHVHLQRELTRNGVPLVPCGNVRFPCNLRLRY